MFIQNSSVVGFLVNYASCNTLGRSIFLMHKFKCRYLHLYILNEKNFLKALQSAVQEQIKSDGYAAADLAEV